MTKRIGYESLLCFSVSAVLFSCVYLTETYLGIVPKVWGTIFWGPLLYFSVMNIFLRFYLQGFRYDVAVRAAGLGCALATGLYLCSTPGGWGGWRALGAYTCAMSLFHFGEFFAIAVSHPESLSLDSFILNHSAQYNAAAIACIIEWALEMSFYPNMKSCFWISLAGIMICLAGELMRKGAMLTAKRNFNHCVQFVKNKEHTLVTHGVYSLCRHPSYVGWFYWSIGTQIIMQNPVCTVLYAIAAWMFFRERVFMEEVTLVGFFGQTYQRYQRSVSTGLPFIKGYI